MIQSYRTAFLVLLFMLLLGNLLWAGTTGKIAGIISDKDAGEPLPGANIFIEGSSYGAATDGEGTYTILNIPPGVYTVQVQMLGYAKLTFTDVRVLIDQTTRLDAELATESVAGEEITIVATRNLVEDDITASVTAITAEEVDALPVTSIESAVQLQAGVEDGLVIRGGAASEALFMVDGFALRDPRNNEPVTGIALSAVQEVSIERGGFNAEYGQVRSGILNIVTKEGSKENYTGSITAQASTYAEKHFDVSPFDDNSMWMRPYLDPDVAFVGTANGSWDGFTQNQYPFFDGWNFVSDALLNDENPSNDLTPEQAQELFRWQHRKEIVEEPDVNIDAGFGGPVPFIGKALGDLRFFTSFRRQKEMLLIPLTRADYVSNDFTLKLTSDISPSIKLSLSALAGNNTNIAVNGGEQAIVEGSTGQGGGFGLINSTDYIRTTSQIASQISLVPGTSASRVFSDSYWSEAAVSHRGVSLDLTHALSKSTFYDFSVDFFNRKYETGPTATRSDELFEITDGVFTSAAPFGWSPLPEAGIGDAILFGGHTSTARDSSSVSSVVARFDLSSQLNFNHQLKTGFEIAYNNLDLLYGIVNLTFPESNRWVDETYNPIRAAFYVQDKIEFKEFIANVGLRLDYANSQTEWVTVDPYNNSFFGTGFNEASAFESVSAENQLTLSPRLGISHPISATSKLFFHYGHFKQLPSYEQMFQLQRGPTRQMRAFGDPNLGFAKTVSYELGFDQALFDDSYLLQLAGFYHDITNDLSSTRYINVNSSVSYNALTNNAYQDVRGLEVSLRKARGKWLTGFFTYTYQVNTFGRFGRDILFENPSEQADFDELTGNFAQNRPLPQPWANLVVTSRTPGDFGPEAGGLKPLSNWNLTLLGGWRAGWWATRNPNEVPDLNQNVQAKDWLNLDLRFSKRFDYKNVNLDFFVDVRNALNVRRLSLVGFYDGQDLEDYWNSLHLPESDAYSNIVGEDRYGEYRDVDVAFQPIIQVANVEQTTEIEDRAWYYETESNRYMQFVNEAWMQVDSGVLEQALEDKAYIDMPNQTSFNFLDPRDVFFGIRTSFDF